MKTLKPLLLASALTLSFLSANSVFAGTGVRITAAVARTLEQGNYTQQSLNDKLASRFLTNYLNRLDFNHLFFTQGDIDALQNKYGTKTLTSDLLQGIPDPAFEISNLFTKRVEERVVWINRLLKQKFDFNSNRTVEISRSLAPWPENRTTADMLWHDGITSDLLQEKLNNHTSSPGKKIVAQRYEELLRNVHEQTRQDVLAAYLSTLAMTFDPHSEYMDEAELENFKTDMDLSIVGLGAEMTSEDGYPKIVELVPGGPAQKQGHLEVGDRIIAVAQGDKHFIDVIGMPLTKIMALTRGKTGDPILLKVIPANATDPSVTKVVRVVRAEVEFKEQQAKAEVIDRTDADGKPLRLGWITLPSFYADLEHPGHPPITSATSDVSRLLERLKQEKITGLVIDVRQNGGGLLREAINMTGLFIKKGPVVQTRDSSGDVIVSGDPETSVAYDGPLIVLTNKLSASASEIFAGALQDYGRAIIVGGEHTFGKGTVQDLVDMQRYLPANGDVGRSGALKLTVEKFYRISGMSTQIRGVVSDIQLPSPYDLPGIGEEALINPLPYDQVQPIRYEKTDQTLVNKLRQLSAGRVAQDPEFAYLNHDLDRTRQRLERNYISLNEKLRRAELAADRGRKERRAAARVTEKKQQEEDYVITMDDFDLPEIRLATNELAPAPLLDGRNYSQHNIVLKHSGTRAVAPALDPIRKETLNILSDFVDLSRAQNVASKW